MGRASTHRHARAGTRVTTSAESTTPSTRNGSACNTMALNNVAHASNCSRMVHIIAHHRSVRDVVLTRAGYGRVS